MTAIRTVREAESLLRESEALSRRAEELGKASLEKRSEAQAILRAAMTPLQLALWGNREWEARGLIHHGDPNAKGGDPDSPAPLVLAFRGWAVHWKNVIPLLDAGADPFAPGVEEEILQNGGMEWLRRFPDIAQAFEEARRRFQRERLDGGAGPPTATGEKRETL